MSTPSSKANPGTAGVGLRRSQPHPALLTSLPLSGHREECGAFRHFYFLYSEALKKGQLLPLASGEAIACP